jgi:predicted DCC family thiol-disulfide oxidoreductase YuxK
LVKALDKKNNLNFVGFSHPIARQLLCKLSEEELASGMHLVETDGTVYTGGEAASALMRHLPGARVIGKLAAKNASTQSVVSGLYRVTAKNRAKLARFVPDVKPVERLPKQTGDHGRETPGGRL